MVEQINDIENKTQEYNFSENKNLNLIIQFIVDGYLKRKGEPSMKELLKEDGIEDTAGIIYNYHIVFLQNMIAEELLIIGINLSDIVNATGEQFELGKLSNYETKYLENKINNVAGLIEVIKEKVNK